MSRIVKCAHIQASNAKPDGTPSEIKEAMIEKHIPLIEEAGQKGAQILCLQEIFHGPYFCAEQDIKWYATAEKVPGPTVERLAEYVVSKSQMKIAIVRPTAVYGPLDNFDPVRAHVIPALILKAVERMDPYEVWGTGEEVRDFLHVRDLARGCLLMLEKYAECDPVNIGYGQVVTVREIVRLILDAADYGDAEIVFNSTRPTAIPFRMVDTSKAKRILGFEPEITLEDGLAGTIEWYLANRPRVI